MGAAAARTVGAPLAPAVHQRLVEQFDVVRVVDEAAIEVALPDGAAFYRLFDVLRSGGCVIEAVDSVEPDLEEIFLNIVKGASRS